MLDIGCHLAGTYDFRVEDHVEKALSFHVQDGLADDVFLGDAADFRVAFVNQHRDSGAIGNANGILKCVAELLKIMFQHNIIRVHESVYPCKAGIRGKLVAGKGPPWWTS